MAPREYSMEKMNYQLGHCDVQAIWIGYSVNQQCVYAGVYNVGSVQKIRYPSGYEYFGILHL